jgi:hypothetical protein
MIWLAVVGLVTLGLWAVGVAAAAFLPDRPPPP